jgi:hypothetical protein
VRIIAGELNGLILKARRACVAPNRSIFVQLFARVPFLRVLFLGSLLTHKAATTSL